MRKAAALSLGFAAGLVAAGLARDLAPLILRRPGPGAGASEPPKLEAGAEPANLSQAQQPGRGRQATAPEEIPPRGWRDILVRTFKEFGDDQIPLISAGVTFFTLLALFPGIGAFVALYGLFADVADAQRHLVELSAILPSGAITLIGDQLVRAAAARSEGLSLAFIVGLGVALWSANGAMKAIITGLNIAYEEEERRGLIGKILIPLCFTIGALLFAMLAIALATLGAGLEARLGGEAALAYNILLAAALFCGFALGLAFLYRFGPSRRRARWRWISWGSGLAALAWLAMSAGFTFYVSRFGTYDRTYGALGAVIGFMTWTWLSAQVILLGAELNSEIEHQTARDTTVGPPKPIGARGAVMADTIGSAQ